MRHDLTYALRSFLKAPTLTAAIIISIAFGIAANTTVFSIVNELLIKDMPVRDSARLFIMEPGGSPSSSLPAYLDFRDQTRDVFEGLAAHSLIPVAANMSAGGNAHRIWGLLVTGNYFQVTGAPLFMGRGVLPSEDEVRGRDAVVVLGYGLWRRLGADANIVGKRVVLSGAPYTVVGVASAGFLGTDRGIVAEFWAPLAMRTHLFKDIVNNETSRNCTWLELTGRLRPGVTREQAVAAANVIWKRMIREYKMERHFKPVALFRVGYLPLLQDLLNPLMAALAVVAGLLLLIACANVANLLLARAASRQQEIGIRLAVGAGRGRIVRQLLTESVLLSGAGAALGFLLAVPGTAFLARVQPPFGIPMRFDFAPDLRVLAFTTALAVLTGILFGLAPALSGTRGNLTGAIRQTGWGGGGSHRGRLASTLVGVQVAFSVILLVAAGLFLRSLQHAASIDTGFKGEGALLMAIDVKGQGYSADKARRFFAELQRRVEALPGVQAMGYIDLPPLSFAVSNSDYADADSPAGKRIDGDTMHVGAHYFAAGGIPLLRGRDFDAARDDKAAVVVINQKLAARLFGEENPIGRHVREDKTVYEVIGVVGNAKVQSLGEGDVPCLFGYLNDFSGGFSGFGVTMIARAAGGDPIRLAGAVQREVRALDPDLPLFNVKPLDDHIDNALLLPRISGALFGAFGTIGLILAVVGLYGVVNYSVRTRTRELGIRMALGAPPFRVAGTIVGRAFLLVAAGLALGLLVAYALSRFTAGFLYGIEPTDPATFLGVPAVLIAAFLAAIALPARRASQIAPMTALRNE